MPTGYPIEIADAARLKPHLKPHLVNLLAYLGHRLGIHVVSESEDAVRMLLQRIRDYHAIHEEHT